MRVVGSSHADPYTSCAAACAALYGPRHGGANEQVVRMLTEIGSMDNVDAFVKSVKEGKGGRLQGFGHRVYKNYDPRATIIKKTADEVFEVTGKNPLLDIALKLEEVALKDEYFTSRKLYPECRLLLGPHLPGDELPDRHVPRAVRDPAHDRLARSLGRAARAGLADRSSAPAVHRSERRDVRPDRSEVVHAVTIVDGSLEWREHPDPEPGRGEMLVAVRAAGINSADLSQRAGFYPAPPGSPPDIPGLELAGEVVATGDGVQRFAEGDRVMAVVGGGGQAELAVVHERQAVPVPETVSWAEAGGFPEVFTTAHDAMFTQCQLQMGERLGVHGAAGGVGLAGVQLGIAAGASVIATVRNESLRDAVAAYGATAIAPETFIDHGPVDVILELVGAPNFPGNLDALAINGRISIIGVGGGGSVELNLFGLMHKRARIHGSTLRTRSLEDKARAARAVEHHVVPLLASGVVRVPVCETFPMSEANAAYERFAAGGKLGKIVLTV